MRVYVTGKIEGMTKKEVKEKVEEMGHEYISFSQNTDLLVFGERPGAKKITNAQSWGIRTISWEDFQKSGGTKLDKVDDDKIAIKVEKRTGPSTYNTLKTTGILWMNSIGFTKVDLKGIDKLTRLTRIHLDGNNLKEIDLSPLEKVSGLSWLMLSYNNLTEVDLKPLSSCTNLGVLELANNHLESIDLSPLSSCSSLSTLTLSSNKISSIDLEPLKGCRINNLYLSGNVIEEIDLRPLAGKRMNGVFLDRNLVSRIDLTGLESINNLNLSGNRLEEVDFSGFASVQYLRTLDLSNNQLKQFDLAPLSNAQSLWKLLLKRNPIESIDLTPMAESWGADSYSRTKVVMQQGRRPIYESEDERGNILFEVEDGVTLLMDPIYKDQIESSEYGFADLKDRLIWTLGPELAKGIFAKEQWPGLKKRLLMLPRTSRLSALSMVELTGLQSPIEDVINNIPDDASFEEGVAQVYTSAVELLRQQLETGGPTKDLDIEEIQKTEAALLIPRILELRKQEVESVVLKFDENRQVHLGELTRTYYGGMLVNELGIGWRTDEEGIRKLIQALDSLDLKITVENM